MNERFENRLFERRRARDRDQEVHALEGEQPGGSPRRKHVVADYLADAADRAFEDRAAVPGLEELAIREPSWSSNVDYVARQWVFRPHPNVAPGPDYNDGVVYHLHERARNSARSLGT
ncbi:MAG: hypothetical protein M3Q71_01960 [Chloroflexota bacterium]|nr:hypothetical protein [Chloroflexota bacterium]